MPPDLVIFDCDGVLVDTEPLSNRVLVDNLARYGLQLTLEAGMAHFVGTSMKHVARRAAELGATLPPDWIDEVYGETFAALRGGVELIPGIPELLDLLDAEGVQCVVASNGSDAKMDITLGQTGLSPRFAGRRFSAHTIGIAKPDPGLFLAAARAMGCAPAATVVIEDSVTGARAAARAGMRCIGYAPDGAHPGLVAEGAELVRSMAQIPAHLGLPRV
jgi:HAD superfamily hydrolase (TIGR01509 family)